MKMLYLTLYPFIEKRSLKNRFIIGLGIDKAQYPSGMEMG